MEQKTVASFNNIQLFSQVKDVQKMLDAKADLILLDESELEKYKKNELEILDIYTANNTRIGAASRKAYIQLGLPTRAVHLFIFNPKGELFLQKRTMNKDTYPGFFGPSTAGHIGLGEEPEISAQRELEEELGIKTPFHYLGTFKIFKPEGLVNQFFYFYIALTDQLVHPDPGEVDSMGSGFYSFNQIKHELDWNTFVPPLKYELIHYETEIKKFLEENGIQLNTD